MHIGFTGTSEGLTSSQWGMLRKVLLNFLKSTYTFHHGDCVGADEQAANIVKESFCKTHIHPPIKQAMRAFCRSDFYEEEKDYLVRNKDIVNSCSMLIATPRTLKEEQRSGTWSTVRYARKQNKPIIIIFPDGSVSRENFNTL